MSTVQFKSFTGLLLQELKALAFYPKTGLVMADTGGLGNHLGLKYLVHDLSDKTKQTVRIN